MDKMNDWLRQWVALYVDSVVFGSRREHCTGCSRIDGRQAIHRGHTCRKISSLKHCYYISGIPWSSFDCALIYGRSVGGVDSPIGCFIGKPSISEVGKIFPNILKFLKGDDFKNC